MFLATLLIITRNFMLWYEGLCSVSPSPYFKILMPTAMVLGGGNFVGKLGYESRILTIRVSTLIDRRGPRENTHFSTM